MQIGNYFRFGRRAVVGLVVVSIAGGLVFSTPLVREVKAFELGSILAAVAFAFNLITRSRGGSSRGGGGVASQIATVEGVEEAYVTNIRISPGNFFVTNGNAEVSGGGLTNREIPSFTFTSTASVPGIYDIEQLANFRLATGTSYLHGQPCSPGELSVLLRDLLDPTGSGVVEAGFPGEGLIKPVGGLWCNIVIPGAPPDRRESSRDGRPESSENPVTRIHSSPVFGIPTDDDCLTANVRPPDPVGYGGSSALQCETGGYLAAGTQVAIHRFIDGRPNRALESTILAYPIICPRVAVPGTLIDLPGPFNYRVFDGEMCVFVNVGSDADTQQGFTTFEKIHPQSGSPDTRRNVFGISKFGDGVGGPRGAIRGKVDFCQYASDVSGGTSGRGGSQGYYDNRDVYFTIDSDGDGHVDSCMNNRNPSGCVPVIETPGGSVAPGSNMYEVGYDCDGDSDTIEVHHNPDIYDFDYSRYNAANDSTCVSFSSAEYLCALQGTQPEGGLYDLVRRVTGSFGSREWYESIARLSAEFGLAWVTSEGFPASRHRAAPSAYTHMERAGFDINEMSGGLLDRRGFFHPPRGSGLDPFQPVLMAGAPPVTLSSKQIIHAQYRGIIYDVLCVLIFAQYFDCNGDRIPDYDDNGYRLPGGVCSQNDPNPACSRDNVVESAIDTVFAITAPQRTSLDCIDRDRDDIFGGLGGQVGLDFRETPLGRWCNNDNDNGVIGIGTSVSNAARQVLCRNQSLPFCAEDDVCVTSPRVCALLEEIRDSNNEIADDTDGIRSELEDQGMTLDQIKDALDGLGMSAAATRNILDQIEDNTDTNCDPAVTIGAPDDGVFPDPVQAAPPLHLGTNSSVLTPEGTRHLDIVADESEGSNCYTEGDVRMVEVAEVFLEEFINDDCVNSDSTECNLLGSEGMSMMQKIRYTASLIGSFNTGGNSGFSCRPGDSLLPASDGEAPLCRPSAENTERCVADNQGDEDFDILTCQAAYRAASSGDSGDPLSGVTVPSISNAPIFAATCASRYSLAGLWTNAPATPGPGASVGEQYYYAIYWGMVDALIGFKDSSFVRAAVDFACPVVNYTKIQWDASAFLTPAIAGYGPDDLNIVLFDRADVDTRFTTSWFLIAAGNLFFFFALFALLVGAARFAIGSND